MVTSALLALALLAPHAPMPPPPGSAVGPAPDGTHRASGPRDPAGDRAAPMAVGGPARSPQWQAPVRPVLVARRISLPQHDWLPGHRGVDLLAQLGAPVRAAGPGIVTFAAPLAGRGVVVIDHGGLRTTYEPVSAEVARGEHVRGGEVIGTVGSTAGHCARGCLHWGLRRGQAYLDPLLLLGGRARLRPW